jgi:hypothetical protein
MGFATFPMGYEKGDKPITSRFDERKNAVIALCFETRFFSELADHRLSFGLARLHFATYDAEIGRVRFTGDGKNLSAHIDEQGPNGNRKRRIGFVVSI